MKNKSTHLIKINTESTEFIMMILALEIFSLPCPNPIKSSTNTSTYCRCCLQWCRLGSWCCGCSSNWVPICSWSLASLIKSSRAAWNSREYTSGWWCLSLRLRLTRSAEVLFAAQNWGWFCVFYWLLISTYILRYCRSPNFCAKTDISHLLALYRSFLKICELDVNNSCSSFGFRRYMAKELLFGFNEMWMNLFSEHAWLKNSAQLQRDVDASHWRQDRCPRS